MARSQPTRFAASSVSPVQGSLYRHVGARLGDLIALFGIESLHATIERAYELLCRESLAFPAGSRPARSSRLNADGTPFQFSLALPGAPPPLQFLTEAGPLLASGAVRHARALERAGQLATLFGARRSLSDVDTLLDEIAPAGDADLMREDAGTFWIGAGFAPQRHPALKLYVNARWGSKESRWARFAVVADRFGVRHDWIRLRALVGELEPLGASFLFSADAPVSGRIYLSGFGRSLRDYESLGAVLNGDAFRDRLRDYGRIVLKDDSSYPMLSVVCSVGLEDGSIGDFKFELCAHCAFRSDSEARTRCAEWLERIDDPSVSFYSRMVDILSGAPPGSTGARLHAYLGIGSRRGRPYSTFYFNPAAPT